ncbi:MAG TPA: NAD(P)/FAD-dependent oxidoreductase [Chitinophagaceae bacterium]|nr:NAD(P)/FAD-dependent oxidoreductase [Chitinophagaceae bacterium]
MKKHLVIAGGGAAGFFCAVNAARMNPFLKVTIVEKSNKMLSKVKVSGGGRCNVTHACFDIRKMSMQYPRGKNFVKKAFHRYFTDDTVKWFEERGVKLKTEADGRMFPVTDSSQSVIDCLLKEVNRYGVEIMMNAEVKNVLNKENGFEIILSDSRILIADYFCIACGGYPKSNMFDWIKDLGHTIEEPVASLFTFNLARHPITKLMGVSLEKVKVKIAGTSLAEQGPLLITHWGLSGPVILRLSAWGAKELNATNYEFDIHVNWLYKLDYNDQRLKEMLSNCRDFYAAFKIFSYNFAELPQRLWEFLLSASGVTKEMRFADLSKKMENIVVRNLIDYVISVKGKTTFKEEFVTAGGIKLSEVEVNTMMSKKVNNLFFAGEVLDVDGVTGGFNFQHAWTSGFIAAKAIAEISG